MNLRDEIRRRFGEQPPGTAEAAGNLEAALEEARRAKAQLAEVQAELAEARSEEHTSELQSQSNLVCRLLLEKEKKIDASYTHNISALRTTAVAIFELIRTYMNLNWLEFYWHLIRAACRPPNTNLVVDGTTYA